MMVLFSLGAVVGSAALGAGYFKHEQYSEFYNTCRERAPYPIRGYSLFQTHPCYKTE